MEVNDDILGHILKKVDSQITLIRAAAVCRQWRRVVANPAFLRGFRSLHAPVVAGDYYNRAWHGGGRRNNNGPPPFFPSSSSTLGVRHFSLDFLPGGAMGPCAILDSRGSLLLMDCRDITLALRHMVVCEPLTRRWRIIPPPADFLDNGSFFLESYLIDGDGDGDGDGNGVAAAGGRIGMASFRVLCLFNHGGVMRAAMFAAAGAAGSSWTEKNMGHIAPRLRWPGFLGRAGDCYFYVEGSVLVVLDGSTGDCTSSALTAIDGWERYSFFVTGGRDDGKPHIVVVSGNTMKVFARLDGGGGEWTFEKSVVLSEATRGLPGYQPSFFHHDQNVLTRGAGFVILSPRSEGPWPYSIDLDTLGRRRRKGTWGKCCIGVSSHGLLFWTSAVIDDRNEALHQQADDGHQ